MNNWKQTFAIEMPEGVEFVAISDGFTTFCAPTNGRPLDSLIADYASTYGFNEPGDVQASAELYSADWNGDDGAYVARELFTLHSDDGKSGRLATQ